MQFNVLVAHVSFVVFKKDLASADSLRGLLAGCFLLRAVFDHCALIDLLENKIVAGGCSRRKCG